MDVTTFTTATGMDSREIAQRTGKNHADVCRDIRRMLEDLREDESKFASVYHGGNSEPRRCYILPKRECLILATGYRVDLRAKIIDRWAELEAEAASKSPKDALASLSRLDILRMAIEAEEKVQAIGKELDAARPAVEFVDRYVEAKATQPLRAVAKILGIKERDFVEFLETEGIMYRLSGRLTPAAEHMEKGRFEVKTGEAHGHAFAQPRFTPAGVEWISRRVRLRAAGAVTLVSKEAAA